MEEEAAAEAMDYLLEQVTHKDMGRRLQVGQEVTELILDEAKSPELEQDQSTLDRMVDAVASSWVNSSNFKVRAKMERCKLEGKKNEHTPHIHSHIPLSLGFGLLLKKMPHFQLFHCCFQIPHRHEQMKLGPGTDFMI